MSDEELEAVAEARELAKAFVGESVSFDRFYSELSTHVGTYMDTVYAPPNSLPEDVEAEVRFYADWVGGEFGETRHLLPKNNDWTYGESTEPYGWIDKAEYRRRFTAAFNELKLARLD